MELAQSVDLDGAVIYPDGLTNSCRLLEAKEGLVDQIKYVAHFPRSFCYWLSRRHTAQMNWLGAQSYCVPLTGSGHGQPIVAVSENSLKTFEMCCCKFSFELKRPG